MLPLMSASQHDLESIAATVADGYAVDWAELDGSDAAAHAGLRQLAKITEAFRSAKSKSDVASPHATAFRFAGLDVIEKIGEAHRARSGVPMIGCSINTSR